jgi:hypothetical protein
MKRMSRICCTLALLLFSLSAVPGANAALKGFSPNPAIFTNPDPATAPLGCPTSHVAGPVPLGGIPAWYQDQNGVAVEACLVPATCGLIGLGDPMFNEACPMSYPDNFPSEAFYTMADAIFPVGPASARVVLAMEYTFITNPGGALITANPRPANALGVPFQRHRLILSYPPGVAVPTAGDFTIKHPWGVTTFPFGQVKCVNNAGGQKCTMTNDMPAPGAVPPNFAAALGIDTAVPLVNTQSTFLRDPLAPTGFLGAATAVASFVGAAPGNANSITVTDGLGNTGTTTSLTILVGKTIGMSLTPGANIDLGGTNIVPPVGSVRVPQTVTVTNTTGNAITFGALAAAGADAADFIITSPPAAGGIGCAGATVAIVDPAVPGSGACSFDITFAPAAVAKAARAATIALAPTTVQPVPPVVPPVPAPPPITMSLKGTALVNVTTAAVGHGTITPATAAVGAGTPVTFTVTPGSKKFKVKEVADGAAIILPSATDPTSFTITGANIGAVDHAVTATFMPSGDLDANGTLDVADAQKALKIVAGIQKADADDPDNTAVKVAPLVGGKPAPDAARVATNIGDVLVILRRVVGLETW